MTDVREADLRFRHREGGCVRLQAETGVIHLQAQESLGPPDPGRGRAGVRKWLCPHRAGSREGNKLSLFLQGH